MKTSLVAAAFIFALLTATSAQITVDVDNSIRQWGSDVDQVNSFLEVAVGHADPGGYAAVTKQIALDEPVQLGILSGVLSIFDPAQSAVSTLKAVFGNVPTDLQSIVDDPSPANVQTQVNNINQVRCCQVLPSIDILWPAAAQAVGTPDQNNIPAANRPSACSTIAC